MECSGGGVDWCCVLGVELRGEGVAWGVIPPGD